MGSKLMRKERLHHHFFANHTFLAIAQHLATHALQISPNQANLSSLDKRISSQQAKKIIHLFEKRIAKRIPVEYITHEAHYLGNQFYVNEHVLVPRSIMNTRFKDFLNDIHWENYRVLDLCTGSGCIGISLALINPHISVDLADISSQALNVAQSNINRHGLSERVKCIESDLFNNINDKYDLIITNPPYVTVSEYQGCPQEFKNEPKIALESGKDGLDIINRIMHQAKNHLNANGSLIAEVGFTAAKRIKKKYRQVPFTWFKYRRPCGKESLLGMHGVFQCPAKGLPENT
jgi:ribosomal protein L3 glutamine methyltransferase